MLKSIDIQNFRSCHSTKVVFKTNVSALVGKNGAGKTNILRCIELLAKMARQSGPISLERPEPDHAGLSIRASVNLDGTEFHYSFVAPSIQDIAEHEGQFIVTEALRQRGTHNKLVDVFARNGEEIKVKGRDAPILISPFAYSIAALSSLLPTDDPIRRLLEPISSFFSGASYYSLEERPDTVDMVPERAYREWVRTIKDGRSATESVNLRLIYMMKEDANMFAEFQALVGPTGLDLVKRTELVSLSSHQVVGRAVPSSSPVQGPYFFPAFEPAAYMGGSELLFPFSQLSDGSRRAIRAITALLFDKRTLMLIEQPEDSIQPGLLHKMIDVLRSYSDRSQIVITTHSPDVLNSLDPKEVLLVSAAKGETTTRNPSQAEISIAKRFLREEGTLSEFLEP
jgi:ABC-type transport system involved in cytochrome c biogenesis ATPase subunit